MCVVETINNLLIAHKYSATLYPNNIKARTSQDAGLFCVSIIIVEEEDERCKHSDATGETPQHKKKLVDVEYECHESSAWRKLATRKAVS